MKEVKPTKRDVAKILGRRIDGWNDKRNTYNRIKITERLTCDEIQTLERELKERFPGFDFMVSNVRWQSTWASVPVIVGAIYFNKKYKTFS